MQYHHYHLQDINSGQITAHLILLEATLVQWFQLLEVSAAEIPHTEILF